MAELNSFGSVMTFAINAEAGLQAYYEQLGMADHASAAEKRRARLERIRREHVVEITLEPIHDLDDASFPLNWDDTSEAGQAANVQALAAFYRAAAPKINVKPASRALERCADELNGQ
jgi:hypothetical protein